VWVRLVRSIFVVLGFLLVLSCFESCFEYIIRRNMDKTPKAWKHFQYYKNTFCGMRFVPLLYKRYVYPWLQLVDIRLHITPKTSLNRPKIQKSIAWRRNMSTFEAWRRDVLADNIGLPVNNRCSIQNSGHSKQKDKKKGELFSRY